MVMNEKKILNQDISDDLVHQIYQTTRIISKSLNLELSCCGLFSSEWTIIKAIKKHGCMTQVALADCLNIEPAAISKSLAKLEKKEIIERYFGQDRREKYIILTKSAIEKYDEYTEIVDSHRYQLLKDLDIEEQKLLIILLNKIAINATYNIQK